MGWLYPLIIFGPLAAGSIAYGLVVRIKEKDVENSFLFLFVFPFFLLVNSVPYIVFG